MDLEAFSPEDLGFQAYNTGGGHWAWRQDFILDGKHVYMLLTNADLSHSIEPGDDIQIGVYLDDVAGQEWTGEPMVFVEILAADRRSA